MSHRKWLLLVVFIVYMTIGLAWGLWEQAHADLNDPSPQPVWSQNLEPGQRIRALSWLVGDVLLWPIFALFLSPGTFQCWLLQRCG